MMTFVGKTEDGRSVVAQIDPAVLRKVKGEARKRLIEVELASYGKVQWDDRS